MEFETGCLYHIYNRGNNSQRIFFTHENYLFFLKKIAEHIIPHADIIAWCLMPTHFHLLIEVVKEEIEILPENRIKMNQEQSQDNAAVKIKKRTINESIGIILRSYTRAIQKQENISGSLFQKSTKARSLNDSYLSPSYFNTEFGTFINISDPETDYLNVCFNYIHNNPVKDGLVDNPEDWEFSSFRDYRSWENGKLVNFKKAKELGLI